MLLSRLALGGLLASAPLVGAAQATPAPTPRYYIGLALYSSDYQPLGGTYYRGVTVPVQLTLGYQLRPRLALQAAVAYSSSTSYSELGKYYASAGASTIYAYFGYDASTSTRATTVAALARYTLTRQAAHRFQFDVLGGLSLVTRRYASSVTRTDTDSTYTVSQVRHYDDHSTQNDLLLTGGASARCRFGRHLEALLDVTLNRNLLMARVSGLPSATALGLRYRFGGLR